MSGVDELDDALLAAEAELAKAREALRDARESQAGTRLEALAKLLARTQEETVDLEKAGAAKQAELDDLVDRVKELERRLAAEER